MTIAAAAHTTVQPATTSTVAARRSRRGHRKATYLTLSRIEGSIVAAIIAVHMATCIANACPTGARSPWRSPELKRTRASTTDTP